MDAEIQVPVEVVEQVPAPYEDHARQKGWKPKEEFEGNQDDWVSAEEFVKREPLFDKIRNQSKELKELRKTVDAMANHFHKATKAAVDSAIKNLKEQRKEAIELGDVNAVEQIDEQIAEQKTNATELKQQGPPPVPPEVVEWVSKNKWFDNDTEMRDFALAYNDTQLRMPGASLEKALEATEKAVKRAFPEKFENQRRESPPAVEGGGKPKNTGTRFNVDRLTSEQKLVYNQYVKQHKIMSHDEYFKSLDEIGELQ